MDDCELLRAYQERRSEPAFTELVERHLGLVYSVALRVVREPSAAQDVAQAVFIQLARRPWTARPRGSLAGWLYRATRCDALDAVRRETRRHQRESEAMNLATMNSSPEIVPDQIAPLLEEAMGHLRRDEQDAVVLRFYEGKTLRETGALLALSEDAARKRVDRALDKMRAHFARAGITASAALLTSALTAHAAEPPPAGLAAKVAGASVAGATAGAGGFSNVLGKIFLMNAKIKIAAVVVAIGAACVIGNWMSLNHAETDSSAKGNGNGGRFLKVSGTNANGKLTRDEALTQWMNYIQLQHLPSGSSEAAYKALNDQKSGMETKLKNQTDPADVPFVLERVINLPPPFGNNQDSAIIMLFELLEASDPALAFSMAGTIPDFVGRTLITNEILAATAGKDPQQALAMLAQLPAHYPSGPMAQAPYKSVFLAWAGTNPAAAAAAADALPAGPSRVEALNSVITSWSRSDSRATLEWAGSLPPQDTDTFMTALISVGESNPNLAAQYLANLQDASVRNQVIEAVIQHWGENEPTNIGYQTAAAEALDWLDHVATGDSYDNNVNYLLSRITKQSPAAAAALMDKVADPATRASAITELANSWGARDPRATLAWLQNLPDSDAAVRDGAVQRLTAVRAETDVSSAR